MENIEPPLFGPFSLPPIKRPDTLFLREGNIDRDFDVFSPLAPSGGGGGAVAHPFKVEVVAADKVKVVYGTVNQEVPTIGGSPLTIDLASSPELNIDTSSGGLRTIYLAVTIDTAFNMTSLIIAEGAVLPADTTTNAYIRIATLLISAANQISPNPRQQVKSNLAHAYAGENVHYFFYGS